MDDFINEDDDSYLRDAITTVTPDVMMQDDDGDPWAFRSLSDSQKTILAILPIPSAILSIFGSSVIIYMAYLSKKEKSWTPYNRLLLAMSIYDIFTSIALGSAAFMNNKETSNKAWAMGNDSTCTLIGFLNQLAYSGTLYNAALSYYFLLTARFGMKNDHIAQCIEPTMHIFNVGFPAMTAFVGLILGVYSESETNLGCWVNRYPKRCDYGPDGTGEPCLSGMIGWIFGGWIGVFTLVSLIINNLIIWIFAKRQIKKAMNARSPSSARPPKAAAAAAAKNRGFVDEDKSVTQNSLSSSFRTKIKHISDRSSRDTILTEDIRASQQRRLRLISSQAFLFVASYFVSNIISYLLRYVESQATSYVEEMELPLQYYILMVLQAILLPLQGLFNMMVYIRPKLIKNRNEFPRESWSWALRRAIWGTKVEPVHSLLGAIDIIGHHDSKGNKIGHHQPLGKDMISSLTNGSGSEENGSTTPGIIRTHRRWSASSRFSDVGLMDAISEVSESNNNDNDEESNSSKNDGGDHEDQDSVDKRSSKRSDMSCSATILMDGSIVHHSPKPP